MLRSYVLLRNSWRKFLARSKSPRSLTEGRERGRPFLLAGLISSRERRSLLRRDYVCVCARARTSIVFLDGSESARDPANKGATLGVQEGKILARLFHPVVTVETATAVVAVLRDPRSRGACLVHGRAEPSPGSNPPSPRRGGSQGRRGLPAGSRLIGGRGLSTNPRPALCFSHHPWRHRGIEYPTLKSGH
jgi:hypothetical protein